MISYQDLPSDFFDLLVRRAAKSKKSVTEEFDNFNNVISYIT